MAHVLPVGWLLVLASVASATPVARSADEPPETPHGPIHLRNLSLIHNVRLGFTPELPGLLQPGQIEARVDTSWTNYWAQPFEFEFDLDHIWLTLAGRLGVHQWLELGVDWRLGYRGESALAGLIRYWHRLIDHVEARDFSPPNRFELRRDGQDAIRQRPIGWGVSDVVLSAKLPVLPAAADGSAISAILSLKCPLGDARADFASGGFDLGLAIVGAFSYRSFTGYFGIAYFRHSQTPVYGFAPLEHQLTLWLGVELRLGQGAPVAIHAELLFATGLANVKFLGDPNMELHTGLSFQLDSGVWLHLSFLENTFSVENAIDMGWHAGLTWRH